MNKKPTEIKSFPGRAVDMHLKMTGQLPGESMRAEVQKWRNDAFEKSAEIVERFGVDPLIAATIRALKTWPFTEEKCPGHIASDHDEKICGRCGIHIDSLRPDIDDHISQ